MRWTVVVLLSSVVPLFEPAPSALGEPIDPVRSAIEKQAVAFSEAFSRADFKALASMYAEDAIVFPPDSPMVEGRTAIEGFWQSARASGIQSVSLTVVDVKASGELAVEVGKAILDIKLPNQPPVAQHVKYVVVWRRAKDGSWTLLRDIWNGLPSAASP